jgi:phospholipase/carboxylesterase
MNTLQKGELAHHHYVYDPGETENPGKGLLLLHGTGGNEYDLLPLAREVAPGRRALSPRGQVLENGMPRYFRRLREGVFDEADLEVRSGNLNTFLAEAREALSLGEIRLAALGFSNGANIASSLLWRFPDSLYGGVLIRPMVPFEPNPVPDLKGKPVLLLFGELDPIVPAAERNRLIELYRQSGADLEVEVLPASHGLTQADIELTRQWVERYL